MNNKIEFSITRENFEELKKYCLKFYQRSLCFVYKDDIAELRLCPDGSKTINPNEDYFLFAMNVIDEVQKKIIEDFKISQSKDCALIEYERLEILLQAEKILKEIAFGPQEQKTSLILKARDLLSK